VRQTAFGLSTEAVVTKISREIFDQQKRPRFGNANPERMHCAFWEWMIRGEETVAGPQGGSLEETGLMMRDGKLKSGYGPYRARDLFGVPREDGPIWTFERYGATRTELPDGRTICIGGEHEDYYDPDFHIYNDVIVLRSDGEIEICGYPKGIFPPTDFHTATLVGDEILVVGCLGYLEDRQPGITPVFSLDTKSYRMSTLTTTGAAPGWIFEHQANLSADGVIRVSGGEFIELNDEKQRYRRNNEEFGLDPETGVWTQITNRNWKQWSIGQEDGGLFVLDHDVRVRDLIPGGAEQIPTSETSPEEARFLVRGVPIRVIAGVRWITIVAEGYLPEEICGDVPEVFRNRVEVLCKKKCVVV
jgi:hypothetical protein